MYSLSKEIKVCRILKLRDDTDIILHNLSYYYNIGVRDVFIMLHLPSAHLLKLLKTFQSKVPDCNIRLLYHDREGKGKDVANEELLKVLTDTAMGEGFSWIIGSDADEFLILRKHDTIQEFIAEYDNKGIKLSLLFKWANYYLFPKQENKDKEFSFWEKMKYRNNYMQWTKAVGKFIPGMYFVQGLHHIGDKIYGQVSESLKQYEIPSDIAFYAHFPYRSKQQFITKQKVQAKKFNDWRAVELSRDPLYFDKLFEKITKERNSWPENLDCKENINKTNNVVYDPIKKSNLMRFPWI